MSSAYTDLKGVICAGCGKSKKRMQSFCRDCYWSLPIQTRKELYQRPNYEVIYDNALNKLKQKPTLKERLDFTEKHGE